MKRIVILLSAFFCLSLVSFAAPISNLPQRITLPDGAILNCFTSGDEYYHLLYDSLGYTLMQNPKDGFYYYARKSGDSLVPSTIAAGNKAALSRSGIMPFLKISPNKIRERYDKWKTPDKPKILDKKIHNNKNNKEDVLQVNNTGIINNIVIFIRFAGESEFTDSISVYDNMFNSTSSSSMKSYFSTVSRDQLTINSSFYPAPSANNIVVSYYDSEHNRNYYRPYSATNTIGYSGSDDKRIREHSLLYNSVMGVASQIPASLNIDNDNDEYVDNVCFVISGNADGWTDLLWPHRWALYSSGYIPQINGKYVFDYNFQLAEILKNSRESVLCHEMFHSLGAPDLYRYYADGVPVGIWDVMSDNTFPPQFPTAYMQWKYGEWIDQIPEITESGTYQLNPLSSNTNNCYKILSGNEYFVLEYRDRMGYDSGLPGKGLIVYRVITSLNGNSEGPPDEVYIFRPNNSDANIYYANLSQESGRTSIGPLTFASGQATNIYINNVGLAGETISFNVQFGVESPVLQYPNNNETYIVKNPTFRVNYSTGVQSYRIQLSKNSSFSSIDIDEYVAGNVFNVSSELDVATYYCRLKSIYEADSSDWSEVSQFSVGAPNIVVFMNESFEGTEFPPSNWERVINFGTYNWERVTYSQYPNATPISGVNMLRFNSMTAQNNSSAVLWTPLIKCKYSTQNQIEFNMFRNQLDDYYDLINVYANYQKSNIGRVLLGTIHRNTGYSPIASAGWNNYSFSIPENFANDSCYLAFEAVSGFGYNLYIDRVKVYGIIQSLSIPQILLPANDSEDVPLSGAISCTKINRAEEYEFWISSSNAFADTVLLSVTTDSIMNYSGLQQNKDYYVKVRAKNPVNIGNWSSVQHFKTVILSKHVALQVSLEGLWNGSTHKPAAVIVEFRVGGFLNTSVLSKRYAALIDSDGNVVLDVNDLPNGSYWVIVRATGYLPIASKKKLINSSNISIDFSSTNIEVYNTNMVKFKNGRYAMKAGQLSGDRTINSSDLQIVFQNSGGSVSIPE